MNATPTVRFLHLRRLEIGYQLSGTGIESRNDSFCRLCATGGVTLAYRDLGDGDYQIGVGRCRPNEHYARKIGRQAAMDNLMHGPTTVLHAEKDKLYETIIGHADALYQRNLASRIIPTIQHAPQSLGQVGQIVTMHILGGGDEHDIPLNS